MATQMLAHAIRALSMDAVQKANSGHPGMPMGMADIAEALWRESFKHNPKNPHWPNRDRFILSNGHGSMLQYSLLHLTGYDLSLDELKAFRQLHSKTPGHPEYLDTPGVETTTGPLGQGLANGVGMALAEQILAAQFNRENFNVVDHYSYVFAGDGCLMEGVSHEACSLAGSLHLGKLIVFYDDNGISIDGKVDPWFSDDTAKRFEAYRWQVIGPIDGHNREEILKAVDTAKKETAKPSLIICKTHIGYGSPTLQGSEKCHGAPLGTDEIVATKKALGWPYEPFEIPSDIYEQWDACEQGALYEAKWQDLFDAYQKAYPDLANELSRRLNGKLCDNFSKEMTSLIDEINQQARHEASRKSSEHCLNRLTPLLPEMLGGSADLSGSNNTKSKTAITIDRNNFTGNYLHYGVREFGMSAIMNGLALHGGFIPFGGTFLVFSDYAKNAVRLSAMMKQKIIYVYSHDSIGLGEDGPTHQPVEQLSSLRATPQLNVWRPADGVETAVAWQEALTHQGPSCLLLSRHTLPFQQRTASQIELIAKGAYVLRDCKGLPEILIIASGSEVSIASDAYAQLSAEGRRVRLVSMPCMEVFLQQDADYQNQVLPDEVVHRIAVEAGSPDSWYRLTGRHGRVIGVSQFGRSAPYQQVYQALNLTADAIAEVALDMLVEKVDAV